DRDVVAVLSDADDFQIRRAIVVPAAHLNAFADRVLSGPVTAREGFVDHHHAGRSLAIPLIECAATPHRNPQRFSVPRTDDGRIHFGAFARLRGVPFDGDAS